jgi:hypothetical protein
LPFKGGTLVSAERSIIERLEALEKENKRLKRMGTVVIAAVILVAVSLMLMGQAAGNRTVEGKEFVLRDSNSNVRARLFMDGSEPKLSLLNTNRQDVADLYSEGDGAALKFENSVGDIRIETAGLPSISIGQENQAMKLFSDGLRVGDDRSSQPSLAVVDQPDGSHLWMKHSDSVGRIDVTSDNVSLTVADKESFFATLGSAVVQTRRTGEKSQTFAASLMLFDKDGKVIWQAP